MKLILHVGLPKTATSALQYLLYSTRLELLRNSILYPHEVVAHRHQFLVSALFNGSFCAELIEKHIQASSDVSTIILSAEGLSVHVGYFHKDSLSTFRNYIKSYQDAKICIVLRNHESWLKSYYKQCIINPASNYVAHHQTSLIFEQFIDLQTVKNIADQRQLVNQIQDSYGVEVSQYNYNNTIVEDLYRLFTNDIKPPSNPNNAQANVSISDSLAEIARQINIHFGLGVKRNLLINLLRLVEERASIDELKIVVSHLKALDVKARDFDGINCQRNHNQGLIVDAGQAEELLAELKQLL